MRENMGLFRGKRIVDGHWIEGSLWLCIGMPKILSAGNIVGYDVAAETVGECTGLKDKNGKKIFEGDIVKATVSYNNMLRDKVDRRTEIYEVKYHTSHCYFYLARDRNNLLFDGNWNYFLKEIEVIGKIHDNPELLES